MGSHNFEPLRCHLLTLAWLAIPVVDAVDAHLLIPVQIVGEQEVERGDPLHCAHNDTDFLVYLTDSGLLDALSRLRLTPHPAPLAHAEATLLQREQHVRVTYEEARVAERSRVMRVA